MKITKKEIESIPRNIIRRTLFFKKEGEKFFITDKSLKIYNINLDQINQIIPYYENKKGFTNWQDFETKWDIGFGEDVFAQNNRDNQWYLKNHKKTDIVKRPSDYWEKESLRRGMTTHSLYVQECQIRQLTLQEFFKTFFN